MKALFSKILLICVAMVFGAIAQAQTYPFTNPTYIPNVRYPAFTIASGVANTAIQLNGIGTTSVQMTGTCTSLAATLQGSIDNGSNWVTLNLYPYNATTAASAVTSMTATGLWQANTAGINQVRVNNSAVSGTACVGTLGGSPNSFALPR